MKLNLYKLFALSVLLIFSQANSAEGFRNYELRAFYGDKQGDTVVVIDVKRMKFIEKVALKPGSIPYPVDRAGYLDKVYAITRGSLSVDVIDADTLEKLGRIKLQHKPRSGEAFNSRLGLALIAGADKPITSIIDVVNDKVVQVTVEDEEDDPLFQDYGGGNASGHPAWLTKNRFVVIDRTRRLIQLWGIEKVQGKGRGKGRSYSWKLTNLDKVYTPTSVHHILSRNTSTLPKHEKRVFYALAEGKPYVDETEGAIPPAILKLRLTANDKLIFDIDGQIDLPGDPTEMGSHHADFHPDGQHIYVGSTEGQLFVLDSKSESVNEQVIATIETGFGTGHTRFVPSRELAIVTNHNDTFVTLINTKNHKKIGIIEVSGPQQNAGEILQSHTSYVSPDNNFYYAFASDNGIFFEINLQNLTVSRILETGGVPVQGSFINWDDFSYSAAQSSSGM